MQPAPSMGEGWWWWPAAEQYQHQIPIPWKSFLQYGVISSNTNTKKTAAHVYILLCAWVICFILQSLVDYWNVSSLWCASPRL
jgi:hypothetical protein